MKILQIISSLNPKGGGVIEGVNQLSLALISLGHQVDVCSQDAPNADWVLKSEIKTFALGPVKGIYGYNPYLVNWLRINAKSYDAVIVNGLWQYIGLAVWRVLAKTDTPYYVFTHGMLDPWFKETYPLKHLKKSLYWPWAEYRVLRDARKVIFTCEEEMILARKSFKLYKVHEAITAFGVSSPPENSKDLGEKFLSNFTFLQNKRIVLYLSRIHEKKGCDLLIQAFAKVASQDETLHLVIAGPDQMNWASKLQEQASILGIENKITWPGMLEGDMKWGAFYASEIFILPSHQENFGIVVAEALACGKPVLISNKVNIWREVESEMAGIVANDTYVGTLELLENWLKMKPEDFELMKSQTVSCFLKHFHISRAANRLLDIIKTN